jgi:DNA primase
LAQLTDQPDRSIYIVFDQDENQAGQTAAHQLAQRVHDAGICAYILELPHGQDPNSYFVSGATAADFAGRLKRAQLL